MIARSWRFKSSSVHQQMRFIMGEPLIIKNSKETLHTASNPEVNKDGGTYDIVRFTESTDPVNAFVVQQMQGESYESAGYIYTAARQLDGRLIEEIDKTRGDNVAYYLAKNSAIENPHDDSASLRFVQIREQGDLNDLPSYRYSSNSLFPEVKEGLESHFARHGHESIREISALAKTRTAGHEVAYALLRSVIHESMENTIEHERWLMRLAPKAHVALTRYFGERVVAPAGELVEVDNDGEYVPSRLRLQPSVVNPKTVLDGIATSIMSDEMDSKTRAMREHGLVYMMKGCNQAKLQPETITCYEALARK